MSLRFQQMEIESEKLKNINRQLKQDNDDKTVYIEKIGYEISKLNSEHKKYVKVYNEEKEINDKLWNENKSLKIRLDDARDKINYLNGNFCNVKPELERLEYENEQLKKELEDAYNEIERIPEDPNTFVKGRDSQVIQLTRQLNSLLAENEFLKRELLKRNSSNIQPDVFLLDYLDQYGK